MAYQLSRQQARLDATMNILTASTLETMHIDFQHIADEQLNDKWCAQLIENDPRAKSIPVQEKPQI